MQCFRYKADRVPVALIIALFGCDLLVYFWIQSTPALLAWMTAGLLPKIFIAGWNHHHQHVKTFRQDLLNRLLEIVYLFHTGVSTNVWILHHNLGHHLHYLDQSKDESGWRRKDGSPMGVIEYTFTIAITGYPRAWKVGLRHAKFRGALIQMGILNLFLLLLLLWHDPLNATLVFVVPMILIYLGTCWNTYYHHAGLDTDNHLHASHNITNALYNRLSGNLGLHTAHHLKQGVHWSELPALHEQIVHQIPPELLSPDFPVIAPMMRKLKSRRLRGHSASRAAVFRL